jgi:thiol-disulfide isomerase/thioredoxin
MKKIDFKPEKLTWEDIESELYEGKEYIDHIQSRREKIIHESNYKAYKPDPSIIQQLKDFFSTSPKGMKILTLGATWCNTCAKVKPSLIRVVEAVGSKSLRLFLLSGVKTTMQSTEENYSWAQKSPPEFHNPKFMVNQIPIVYFFNEDGQCLTRIEKYPENGLSYEEAILNIIKEYNI